MRRAILGLAALLATAASAAPASALLPVQTKYGPLPTEVVTVYVPEGTVQLAQVPAVTSPSPLAPSVLLVHGGGWRQQPNETEQAFVAQDLRSHGLTVFDINYPQANLEETAFPKQPEAIASAIAWVREHASEFGGDPGNLELLGGSAGGHLVDLAGERVPGIRTVVSLSGPTNLSKLVEMGQREELRSSLAISLAMALGCGSNRYGPEKLDFCTPSQLQLAAEYSPVAHVPASGCPKYMLFSSEEDLVPLSQQQEFLPALQGAGCSASLTVLSGKGHSFGYWWRIKPQVIRFLAQN